MRTKRVKEIVAVAEDEGMRDAEAALPVVAVRAAGIVVVAAADAMSDADHAPKAAAMIAVETVAEIAGVAAEIAVVIAGADQTATSGIVLAKTCPQLASLPSSNLQNQPLRD